MNKGKNAGVRIIAFHYRQAKTRGKVHKGEKKKQNRQSLLKKESER